MSKEIQEQHKSVGSAVETRAVMTLLFLVAVCWQLTGEIYF